MYQVAAVHQTCKVKSPATFQKFQKEVQPLRVTKTKVPWRNAFIDNRFTLKSEKESKNYKKTLLRHYPQILELDVNAWSVNPAYMWFSGLFQCQPFFGWFLLLFYCQTNFIKLQTKFLIKQVKFLPSRGTSFLLYNKLVQ